jgi:hypothetical protein
MVDGIIGHYRVDEAVRPDMARHVRWHHVARRMLGLPAPGDGPLPDYVSAMSIWDPVVLRKMQQHITTVTGKHWFDAVAGELHVSEFMLYGIFADEVLGDRRVLQQPLCHDYYERVPLTSETAAAFAESMPPDSFGAMVSSHSKTPMSIRAEAFARCRQRARRPERPEAGPGADRAAAVDLLRLES